MAGGLSRTLKWPLVPFLARAHVWAAGSVPGQGAYGRQLVNVSFSHQFLSLSLSHLSPFPLSLKLVNMSSGKDLKMLFCCLLRKLSTF